jgi:hypothetical protein
MTKLYPAAAIFTAWAMTNVLWFATLGPVAL